MKKLIVIGIVAVMVMGFAMAAGAAAEATWYISLQGRQLGLEPATGHCLAAPSLGQSMHSRPSAMRTASRRPTLVPGAHHDRCSAFYQPGWQGRSGSARQSGNTKTWNVHAWLVAIAQKQQGRRCRHDLSLASPAPILLTARSWSKREGPRRGLGRLRSTQPARPEARLPLRS